MGTSLRPKRVYKFLQCHLSEKFGQILDMTSHTTTGAGAKLAPAQVQSNAKVVPRLFSGFSPNDIAGIMAAGVVRRIAAGEIIVQAMIRESDIAKSCLARL